MSFAPGAYEAKRNIIDLQLEAIKARLIGMDERQKRSPKDWGWVGNAAHVNEQLAEIMDFLSR